jgi:DNA invertase Pin-like site-specific DNA recombinase
VSLEGPLTTHKRPWGASPVFDSQLEQLRGAGCTKIYREKVTGAHSDRRELLKMLAALARGDVVTVTRIDRLARSTFDLFGIVKRIVEAKAQFRSLAEPWADTGTSTGRLMIAVLGGFANVERDLIRTRTAEGRSRAKAQGQHMGRPRPNGKRPPDAARYARRTRPQLQCWHIHYSPRDVRRITRAISGTLPRPSVQNRGLFFGHFRNEGDRILKTLRLDRPTVSVDCSASFTRLSQSTYFSTFGISAAASVKSGLFKNAGASFPNSCLNLWASSFPWSNHAYPVDTQAYHW